MQVTGVRCKQVDLTREAKALEATEHVNVPNNSEFHLSVNERASRKQFNELEFSNMINTLAFCDQLSNTHMSSQSLVKVYTKIILLDHNAAIY